MARRYCPLCEQETDAFFCPNDGVPTVVKTLFTTSPKHEQPGDVVAGRYRIVRSVGVGGMGCVYLATQMAMHREVALKMMRKDVVHDRRQLQRFYNEAQAISRLRHPNIVTVYDFGIDSDTHAPFLVMEYIDGATLRAVLSAQGSLSIQRACAITAQLARALHAAHSEGLVHRDLKPGNVMVSRHADGDEHAHVLDFGIAKFTDAEDRKLTVTGAFVGTPAYMSPEQIRGDDVDGRTDLYALGCILYEALSGTPPFSGDDQHQVMLNHLSEPAPPLEGAFPDALSRLTASMLAKEKGDRPPDAAVVANLLGAIALGDAHPDVAAIPELPARTPAGGGGAATRTIGTTRTRDVTATIDSGSGKSSLVSIEIDALPPSEERPAPKRRGLVWGGLAVLLIALLLVGRLASWASGDGGPAEPQARLATIESAGTSTSPTAPGVDLTPGAAVTRVGESQPTADSGVAMPQPGVRLVRRRLISTPPGALVVHRGRKLGRTPLNVMVGAQPLRLELRLVDRPVERVTVGRASPSTITVRFAEQLAPFP